MLSPSDVGLRILMADSCARPSPRNKKPNIGSTRLCVRLTSISGSAGRPDLQIFGAQRMKRSLGVFILQCLLLLLIAPTSAAFAEQEFPLVYVQVPLSSFAAKQPAPSADGMRRDDICRQARIVLLSPGSAKPETLTKDFHSACEPDVSFDGKRILFAGKRSSGDNWNIFEMNADGSAVRQVTNNLGNCRQPVYQSTFYTIVSTEPWYQITFVSDAAGQVAEYGDQTTTDLYSCRLDGAGIRRLTFNPSGDQDPLVMPDGRILYVAWQRGLPSHGSRGIKELFTINSDGSDLALFARGTPGRVKQMPSVADSGICVFVEATSLPWDGAGSLGSVSLRRPFHSYRRLTEPGSGLFVSPSPYDRNHVLTSMRPEDGTGSHGIVLVDTRTGAVTPLYDDPKFHDVQARRLVARSEPDGRSSVVDDEIPTAQIYALNIAISDIPNWLQTVHTPRVRVFEGVPKTAKDTSAAGVASDSRLFLPKRLLGEAPVESDGSFFLTVPASTPLMIQIVDEEGIAVRSCNWIWAKNNEKRGCIGCHEDPELTPENAVVEAVKKDAIAFTLAPERRRTVDFAENVTPVIERSCTAAACHSESDTFPLARKGASEDDAVYARRLFLLLTAREPGPPETSLSWKYVDPGRARTSPLTWHLTGRNAAREWDSVRPSKLPMLEEGAIGPMDRRTMIEWIDMGAAWIHPTPDIKQTEVER